MSGIRRSGGYHASGRNLKNVLLEEKITWRVTWVKIKEEECKINLTFVAGVKFSETDFEVNSKNNLGIHSFRDMPPLSRKSSTKVVRHPGSTAARVNHRQREKQRRRVVATVLADCLPYLGGEFSCVSSHHDILRRIRHVLVRNAAAINASGADAIPQPPALTVMAAAAENALHSWMSGWRASMPPGSFT